MALSYHWVLLISSVILSASFATLVFFVDIVYHILSVAGVTIVIMWFSWQLSKLLKALYDVCCGRMDPEGKVVLVTGCSSGFGYGVTVRLDKLGFHVIGCCRNIGASSVQRLKAECSDRLQVIRMDVSSDEEVDQVRMHFEKMLSGRKLWAVVNNAGIAAIHGVEWGSGVNLFKDCLEINTLGMIRVTRTFLPFLRESPESRLVIVTSVEDRVEPLNQPSYAASKFAARAFANSCRRELRDMGVQVSMIAPAFYATELANKENLMEMLAKNWNDSSSEVRSAYGPDRYQMFVEFTEGMYALIHNDITPVVNAISDAVSKTCQPRFHHRVAGFAELLAFWVTDILPDELIDAMTTNSLFIAQLKMISFLRKLFR